MTRRERRGDKEKKGDTRARMSKQCERERETRDSLALRLQDRWVCVGENCVHWNPPLISAVSHFISSGSLYFIKVFTA